MIITISDRKNRVTEILKVLFNHYPNAQYYLNFSNPLQLLVAAILSAQCRDEVVNKVTRKLFDKYKTVDDYAEADLEKLQEDISEITFNKNKAKYIRRSAGILRDEYNGKVPQTIGKLTELPGIGKKTANAILTNAFNLVKGIVVDTHVMRLSTRMGLTEEKKAAKIEEDLKEIVPGKYWKVLPWLFKDHGRETCTARKPTCSSCVIEVLCPKIGVD